MQKCKMSESNTDTLLAEYKSDQLVLELLNRDLASLPEELKSIILYKVGSSLKETLLIESRSFTGNSKNLTSFENIDIQSFICSDDRSLPVIKFIEGITGKDFNTLQHSPCVPYLRNAVNCLHMSFFRNTASSTRRLLFAIFATNHRNFDSFLS